MPSSSGLKRNRWMLWDRRSLSFTSFSVSGSWDIGMATSTTTLFHRVLMNSNCLFFGILYGTDLAEKRWEIDLRAIGNDKNRIFCRREFWSRVCEINERVRWIPRYRTSFHPNQSLFSNLIFARLILYIHYGMLFTFFFTMVRNLGYMKCSCSILEYKMTISSARGQWVF